MILRTRFAPSPTGYLHLGHVVHMLYVWGIARAAGAEVLLRIEDHDRQRCRPEYESALLEDLAWLGLVPDVVPTPCRQQDREVRYAEMLEDLHARGLVYACACSRTLVLRRTGQGGGELRYDNYCRSGVVATLPPLSEGNQELAAGTPLLRVRLEPLPQRFHDLLLQQTLVQLPAEQCGDLVVRDRLGNWTYQFCVAIDDMDHGVNLVIRGMDLLASTGRQLQLAALLGRRTPLHFLHHPLLVDATGRKLSKRDFAEPVRALRASGISAEAVAGTAAHAAGLQAEDSPIFTADLPELMFRIPDMDAALARLRTGETL